MTTQWTCSNCGRPFHGFTVCKTSNQAIVAAIKSNHAPKVAPTLIVKTLAQWYAMLITSKQNCERMRGQAGSDATAAHYRDMSLTREADMNKLAQFLPRGSGIDNGSTFNLLRSGGDVLRFGTAFHHMNENGFYDGWTEHTVSVRPTFTGLTVDITGRDRNQIKDYLSDVFRQAMEQSIVGTYADGHMSFALKQERVA